MHDSTARGVKVYGRTGTDFESVAGELTGGKRRCTLEGCSGTRVYVRWPDGQLTYPCLRGMRWDATLNAWRIGG